MVQRSWDGGDQRDRSAGLEEKRTKEASVGGFQHLWLRQWRTLPQRLEGGSQEDKESSEEGIVHANEGVSRGAEGKCVNHLGEVR